MLAEQPLVLEHERRRQDRLEPALGVGERQSQGEVASRVRPADRREDVSDACTDRRDEPRHHLGVAEAVLGDRDELTLQPAMSSGQTFFRAEGEADEWLAQGVDALSRAALAPAPESGPLDELDLLFVGGPEA